MSQTRRGFIGLLAGAGAMALTPVLSFAAMARSSVRGWFGVPQGVFVVGFEPDEDGVLQPTMKWTDFSERGSNVEIDSFSFAKEKDTGWVEIKARVRPIDGGFRVGAKELT